VQEITGISPTDSDDINDRGNFDAAYKEVQRIVENMQKTLGVKGTLKIHHSQKDGFVQMARALYFESYGSETTGQARHLYSKLINNKLSEQDMIQLTEHFKESWRVNPDTVEKQILLEQVRIEEAYIKWMDDVKNMMYEDITLVDRLTATSRKEKRMQEYLNILYQGLENWRNQISMDLYEEELTQQLADIAVEKGYDPFEVLSNKENPAFQELYQELVSRNSKKLMKQIEDRMKQQLL